MANGDLFLGIDVGTSAIKATVVDAADKVRSSARRRTPWTRLPTGAECRAEELFAHVTDVAREAITSAGPGHLRSIGVASMAETGVLLDIRGRPMTPMIAWFDTRGAEAAEWLRAAFPDAAFEAATGLPLSGLCSLAKYVCLRAADPALAKGTTWLSVAEWIVFQLTGNLITERSLASRTGFLEIATGRPWEGALNAAGCASSLLREPVASGAPCGQVLDASSPLAGAAVTVAGMDHLVAAIGVHAGESVAFDSCGTAEAFVATLAPPMAAESIKAAVQSGVTVGWHALPDRLALLAAQMNGASLQRILDLLDATDQARTLDEQAAEHVDRDDLPVKVVGTADGEPSLCCLSVGVTPAIAWAAAVRSVADSGAELVHRLEVVAGHRFERIVAAGGWVQGRAAQRAKERALGSRFSVATVVEATALGAARIARSAFEGI